MAEDAGDTAAPVDRWTRNDRWGVVLDAPDVAVLARFYAELRGWRIHHLDEQDGSLDPGEGVAYLNIQRKRRLHTAGLRGLAALTR